MYDVVAIGEVLIDFVGQGVNDAGYPVLSAYPGGAPVNFLTPLARYGASAAMIAKVGTDAFAQLLLGTMREQGIDVQGVVQDDACFTTLAFVTLDSAGDRAFSFARKPGADTCLRWEEVDGEILDSAKMLYFGTTALTHEPMRSTVKKAVVHAKERGAAVVFDPNLRKMLWRDLNAAKEEMLWGLAQADIVKMSEEEAAFLLDADMETAAHDIQDKCGTAIVFITRGAQGCLVKGRGEVQYVAGYNCVNVVDTTGAGDIFTGSALWKLLQAGQDFSQISQSELLEIAQFANVSAGLSTEKHGGMSSVCPLEWVNEARSKHVF